MPFVNEKLNRSVKIGAISEAVCFSIHAVMLSGPDASFVFRDGRVWYTSSIRTYIVLKRSSVTGHNLKVAELALV